MLVRPIVPADEAAYRSVLERTSEEDRYFRFFHAVDALDPADVHRFVESRPDMIGVIATDGDLPLGAAHAALDWPSAELAVVVAEDARGRGVGRALLATLTERLRALGYRHIVAEAMHENVAFAALARSVGLHPTRTGGSSVFWVRDLAADAAPEDALTLR